MYDCLLTNLNNGIFTVTINRPTKLNALNFQVLKELASLLNEIEANKDIHSVVFIGSGEKAFVAGADIDEFNTIDANDGMRISKAGQDLFFRIEQSKKPMVACVNGFALGGGCELAMSCHIRIASENAKFAQPEINLGLIPGYGGTQRLVQLIGKGRALELMLTGNMIDATTALAYGLVNRVVPIAQLLPVAYEMLHTIQSKAPVAIAACIKTANAAGNNGYLAEQTAFAECFATADKIEGVNAFLQKRKPHFTGH